MVAHITSDSSKEKLVFPFPPLCEHSIFFYPYDKPTIQDPVTGETESLYGCTIVGPQSDRIILSFGFDHLVVKIGLQPGGLYRLLGIPMNEMLDRHNFNGEDVFGLNIRNTIDAIAGAKDFNDMKIIAEDFILSYMARLKKIILIDRVIPDILRYGGMIKIDQLVKKACLSNRQFERVFKERMGLSPKFYSRLVRFSKAWLFKENNPSKTWTEVAYACDYFDQMHLIRDFKTFAGTNPKVISDALEKQPFSLNNKIFY